MAKIPKTDPKKFQMGLPVDANVDLYTVLTALGVENEKQVGISRIFNEAGENVGKVLAKLATVYTEQDPQTKATLKRELRDFIKDNF